MRLKQPGIFFIVSLFAISRFLFVNSAYGYVQPSFSTCLNPQTQIQVSHPDGTHGVPGDTKTYTGSDIVYAESNVLSSSSVMQCLCQTGGGGIQTNWWKASDLSDDEIKVLQTQGWIYIPDGSAWGLDSAVYLAQNTGFSCGSSNQNNTNNSGGSNSSGSSNPSDPGSSSNSGQSSVTQAVLGAFTQLADTGNMVLLYSLLIIGIIASGLGIIIRKK